MQFDFPFVSQIARDHLAIPAMSAPLKSVFSDGANAVTKNRDRLSGGSVWEIARLRDWGVITEKDTAAIAIVMAMAMATATSTLESRE